jgi:hypothetical protein
VIGGITVSAGEITSANKISVREGTGKIILFWNMSCGLGEGITISEQSAAFIFTEDILQMEIAYFFEMFILTNSTTQSHIQVDHDLYTQSSELKGTNCWGAPGYCTWQN